MKISYLVTFVEMTNWKTWRSWPQCSLELGLFSEKTNLLMETNLHSRCSRLKAAKLTHEGKESRAFTEERTGILTQFRGWGFYNEIIIVEPAKHTGEPLFLNLLSHPLSPRASTQVTGDGAEIRSTSQRGPGARSVTSFLGNLYIIPSGHKEIFLFGLSTFHSSNRAPTVNCTVEHGVKGML